MGYAGMSRAIFCAWTGSKWRKYGLPIRLRFHATPQALDAVVVNRLDENAGLRRMLYAPKLYRMYL
jgi:hypothetical protein